MLRTLLADRFRLTVHEETKEGPVFALVLGGEGPKLTGAKDKNAFPVVAYGRTGIPERPDFLQGINASMERFAVRLAAFLDRPVLDQTGLKGTFDFRFEYMRSLVESAGGPSLTSAIQDLGLKLVATKGPVVRLVIDQAVKPSEN